MKIEHELFAHHFLLTGDKDKAYKAAYPHAEGIPLKTAARRLIQDPEIREYICKELKEARAMAVAAQQAEQQRFIEQELATLEMKRQVLRRMICGEYRVQRVVRFRGHMEIIEDAISPAAVLRAIDLDTRLANDWYHKTGSKPAAAPARVSPSDEFSFPLPPIREGHEIPYGLQGIEMLHMGVEPFYEKHYGPDYLAARRARDVARDPEYFGPKYEREGLRVLDYVPTDEQMLEWQGYYARQRRRAEAEREKLKKEAEAAAVQRVDADGHVQVPEIPSDIPGEDPMSIQGLYAHMPKPRPVGGSEIPGNEIRVVSSTKPGANETDPFDPGFPQCKTIPLEMRDKVNPLSLPPVFSLPPLTPEQVRQKLDEEYKNLRNDPGSIYYTPNEKTQ